MKLEYGLLIALMASVIVLGITHLQAELNQGFADATNSMSQVQTNKNTLKTEQCECKKVDIRTKNDQ